MNSLDTIRAEIAELRDAIAGTNARREQIAPEIADHEHQIHLLLNERARCLVDSEAANIQIRALERAEAVLIEHTAPEPAPVDQEPEEQLPLAPEPVPVSATRQRVRDDLRDSARARVECDGADRRPAGEAPDPQPSLRRNRPRGGDPLRVLSREGTTHVVSRAGTTRTFVEDGGYANRIDFENLSATEAARAELVYGLLEGGEASGMELRDALMDELGHDHPGTVQTIVGRSLAILYHQGRVETTGEKAPGSDGRLRSLIWRIVS